MTVTDDDWVEDAPIPVPTPEPDKIKTGWCMTNQHRLCHIEFNKIKCSCTCSDHGADYVKQENGMSPDLQVIAARYISGFKSVQA